MTAIRGCWLGTVWLLVLPSLVLGQAKKAPAIQELPEKAPAWLTGYRVRFPLRLVGDPTKDKAQSVIVSLPAGCWLKSDASDLAIQNAAGDVLPATVLSHNPKGETIVQFKRSGNDAWYWAYAINEKPLPRTKLDAVKEGLTLELRDWAGDDLDSWVKVRDGLNKSDNVIGNALVAEVQQNGNPARFEQPTKFAASYRGYLDIKKDGVYRFYVNADDAAFLFIDGFKVFERPGANQRLFQVKQKFLLDNCAKIELKAGAHPFEVHHVVGNNAQSQGVCSLLWMPEDAKLFGFVPRENYVQPLLAQAVTVEEASGGAATFFVHGIDDALSSGPIKLYLVRFEAQGEAKDADKLVWDFGDGTTGTGRSVLHVYFKDGDHTVSLKSGEGLPVFKRTVNVWAAPGASSPLSLGKVVKSMETIDWKTVDLDRARQAYVFLLGCEQPERWPLIEKATARLLGEKELELEERVRLTTARMEALANLGKGREALKLADEIEKSVAKVPSLFLSVRLAAAAVHQYHLKDATTASKIYKGLLDEYRRVEHPNLRIAAIRWGDLYAEAGDLARAGDAYKLAVTLGGEKFAKSATVDAVTRGARLRIAEQKLKAGDVRGCRQLLDQIEIDFPQQKLEGLYRFLRAESDRNGGHYEDAIRNYEVLVRLPQWAGYRGQALHGIADSYYRMGYLDKALEWYGTIKETHAAYYEKQKLAAAQKLIQDRVARIKAARDKGEKVSPFFEGLTIGFEPGDPRIDGETKNFVIGRGPGMQGPHVGMTHRMAEQHYLEYIRPIKNLNPGATYWVEFWYRETWGSYNRGEQQIYAWIAGDGLPNPQNPTVGPIYPERTYGQWRKCGFKVKVPAAQDGQVRIIYQRFRGALEIDGLIVRPISDRENDSLSSFLEGSETP